MPVGKVPPEILDRTVFRKIRRSDPRILVTPGTGEDCSIIDLGSQFCVLSCDPITGASNDVGKLAVHVSCNDIASAGLRPFGLMVTLLLPPGSTPSDLDKIMSDICNEAADLDISILGGHTEVTDAVSRTVVTICAVAFADHSVAFADHDGVSAGHDEDSGSRFPVVRTGGARPGDLLIMTKTAGLEGTAVIANDHSAELEPVLGKKTVSRARAFMEKISVMKEGIIGGRCGVSSMHDVTEGGIFGAAYEIAEASGCGVILEKDKIPVAEETVSVCSYYGISPYQLISSGCMAMTIKEKNAPLLLETLRSENIPAAVIGRMTEEKEYLIVSEQSGKKTREPLLPPGSDELYKV